MILKRTILISKSFYNFYSRMSNKCTVPLDEPPVGRVTRNSVKRKVMSAEDRDESENIVKTEAAVEKHRSKQHSIIVKGEPNISDDGKLASTSKAAHSKKETPKQHSHDDASNLSNDLMTKKEVKSKKSAKSPRAKIEKPAKTQKSGSAASVEKNGVSKPALVIPEIVIPVDKPRIPRTNGPSPWNGTIKYENKVFLGAHISAAGGLENAITNAMNIGGTSFALFLKNQRQWVSKPMEDFTVKRFKDACAAHNFSPHLILPHGSYLMNCGSSDSAILGKSRATLLDEVQRCERLGILYYNIHPGSSCGKGTRDEAIQLICDSINWVHDQTPGSKVAVVLENMCRQGNTVGGDLSDLADIIKGIFDQSRIGVCLDTCHAFAAGYDLATSQGFAKFLQEFERVIGFRYLVAVHLNDSEGALGCHRDRHASIGKGKIGLEGFKRIVNCPRFRDIPIVLETPYISDDHYKQEIILLKSLAEPETICA